MQSLMTSLRVVALSTFCCIGAGCGITRNVGLADRCAEFMQLAYPSATIDIGKREAAATSLTTIIATAEGMRTDLPPDVPLSRNLAVECRFDGNILTGFRWTAGPSPPSAPPQAGEERAGDR
jgi:hypothetical protein